MYSKKRVIYMGLFLAVLVLMAGCGKKKENAKPEEKTSSGAERGPVSMTAEDGSWIGEGGCYKLENLNLADGTWLTMVNKNDVYEVTYEDNKEKIYLGNKLFYEPSGLVEEAAAGDAGICLLNKSYDADDKKLYKLEQVEYDRKQVWEKDITKYIQDEYPIDMGFDGKGQIFLLLSDNTVLVFSKEGSHICTISLGKTVKRLVLDGNGTMHVTTCKGNKEEGASSGVRKIEDGIWLLEPEKKTAKQAAAYEGCQLFDGGDKYLFTVLNDKGIYGMETLGQDTVPIALWTELSLSFQNINDVEQMEEGSYIIRDSSMTAKLVSAEPSEVKAKTAVTIASVTPYSNLPSLISDFNLQSQDYVVRSIDYSQNGQITTEEAINQLNMDIIAGEYPDLFDFGMLPEAYYSEKGLLEDIYTYIDDDPDVSREDFVLLDKLEQKGRLYYVAGSYSLDTAVGLESRFGDSQGWSLDDYLKIQSQNDGEIMYNVTRENFLRTMIYRYAAKAVDWQEKTCDFETEEFLKILNATAKLRENPEPENPADMDFTPGGVRLKEGTLIAIAWYMEDVRSIAEAREETGEEISCIGWPTPDGSGGTSLSANRLVGMCSKGNKKGAWEFIKYLITEGAWDNTYGISVNKEVLEAQTAEAMSPSKEDETKVIATEEDKQQFYDLMDQSVFYGTASDKAADIIMEEAAAFLAGDKTAEETARIIQSRVSLLVAE